MVNLAFDSEGQLFGWGEAGAVISVDDLFRVNTRSAEAIRVGESGINNTNQNGMAFDDDDNLYLLNGDDRLFLIDTTTGVAGSLGTVTKIQGTTHG